jgi:hypothetical protein
MTNDFGVLEGYVVPETAEDEDFYEEEVYEEIYQKAPMRKLISSENVMNIGTDIETGTVIGITEDCDKPFFICNKHFDETAIAEIMERYIAQHEVNIISSKRGFDIEGHYVDDVDSFIFEYTDSGEDKNRVLVIDGFADFYDVISDEALVVLEKALRNGFVSKIITIDDMTRIRDYCDTELYLRLVRCADGMVMGGEAANALAVLLNNDFYMIPEDYRKVPLQQGQAIVYSEDRAAYVQLGGI